MVLLPFKGDGLSPVAPFPGLSAFLCVVSGNLRETYQIGLFEAPVFASLRVEVHLYLIVCFLALCASFRGWYDIIEQCAYGLSYRPVNLAETESDDPNLHRLLETVICPCAF